MRWMMLSGLILAILNFAISTTRADDSGQQSLSFKVLRDVPVDTDLDRICCNSAKFSFSKEGATSVRAHYGERSIWLKLENVGTADLIQLSPVLDDVTLYSRGKSSATWREVYTGDQVASDNRMFASPFMVLPLDTDIDFNNIYIRIVQRSSVSIKVSAWQQPAFVEMQNTDLAMKTFMFGFVISIIVYNAVVTFLVRDAVFLFNALCIFCLLIQSLYLSGYGTLYVWDSWVGWSNSIFSISAYFAILFGAIFFWFFLEGKQLSPGQVWPFFFAPTIATFGAISGLIMPPWFVQLCMIASAGAFFFTMLALAIARAIRGDMRARILLIPLGAAMAPGIGLVVLEKIFGIKIINFGNNGLEITLCIEAVIFSLALASRIRLAEQATRAMHNSLLLARSESAARAIGAQDAERKRLAQELHDGVGQDFLLVLGSLKKLEADNKLSDWSEKINEVIQYASNAMNDLRRVSRDMHPAAIEHLGLKKAIESLLINFESSTQITMDMRVSFDEASLDTDTQVHVYRILQECLANIGRHANANKCKITLNSIDEELLISAEDDGIGMEAEAPLTDRATGLGLYSIDERVRIANGKWACTSSQLGGLRVDITIPHTSINE